MLLTSLVFDSILVKPHNDIRTIKFSGNEVTGYSDNLFEVNSVWDYEKLNYSEHTSFSTHPIESHDYIFVIEK
ncbi:MAG: hypothetical protein HC905_17700 [Bacteroidales bacterium]|nr:hypothetical protein [Bacteroidales bacterium]